MVVFRPFASDTFGGFDKEAEGLLQRLQALVPRSSLAHEDLVCFSIQRRLAFAIARAVGRQLASRLPYGRVELGF